MKHFFILILSTLLLVPPTWGHKELGASQFVHLSQGLQQWRSRNKGGAFKSLLGQTARSSVHSGARATAAYGQTALMIMLFAAAELYKEKLKEAELSGFSMSSRERQDLKDQAIFQTIDDAAIWMGTGMAFSVLSLSAATKSSLSHLLSQAKKNPATRKYLAGLIQIGMFKAFLSLSIVGSRFWQQAQEMGWGQDSNGMTKPFTDKEYSYTNSFSSIIKNGFLWSANSSRESQVSRQVFKNFVVALFFDSERRKQAFYDAFRLDLTTGDYIIMSTLVGGSIAAGSIVPGVGNITMALLGVVAGGLAIFFVPDRVKQKITDSVKWNRYQVNISGLRNNLSSLWRLTFRAIPADLSLVMSNRHFLRGRTLTPLFELYLNALNRLSDLDYELTLAKNYKDKSAMPDSVLFIADSRLQKLKQGELELNIKKIEKAQVDALETLKRVGEEMGDFYTKELESIGSITDRLEHRKKRLKKFGPDYADEIDRVLKLSKFFGELSQAMAGYYPDENLRVRDLETLAEILQVSNHYGFIEDEWL